MRHVLRAPGDEGIFAAGGLEVRVSLSATGELRVNVLATGPLLDPRVLLLDEEGDACVTFLRDGVHQVSIPVPPARQSALAE